MTDKDKEDNSMLEKFRVCILPSGKYMIQRRSSYGIGWEYIGLERFDSKHDAERRINHLKNADAPFADDL